MKYAHTLYMAALYRLNRDMISGIEGIEHATDHGVEDGFCSQGYQNGLILKHKCECLIRFDRTLVGVPRPPLPGDVYVS